jgi:homoserine O-acetyltransferase
MSKAIEPTFEGDFTFAEDEPFRLGAGGELEPVTLRYTAYGKPSPRCDNVILVCHALSGSARVGEWWPEMFGPGRAFDLDRHCVVCSNILGSCYGSTGPTSINPATGRVYAGDFPVVTIHDMARAQSRLIDHLGVERLVAVVGGSIGGMQALSWAVQWPERVDRCVVIGAAPLSAMGLALSHLQRQMIRQDPAWKGGHYPPDAPPSSGLALARSLAMCTYKSAVLFDERYHRKPDRSGESPVLTHEGRYDVGGYLDYQGRSFLRRFDANCYLVISKAQDTWDLGEGMSEAEALRRIRSKVLMVGISSDWLFPAADVQALAERMRAAGVDVRYAEQVSNHGHDAFLADADQLSPVVTEILHEARSAIAVG